MQGYTGPAALNEGIRAIGDVFSPETAMNRQKAIMYKQQFEQTMKPLTLDEIAAKTSPDLWGPLQKLAESNGIVEENNGVKFIRQGNLRQFHDDFGKNKIWQAQVLDESSKLNKAKLDEITPQYEQAKKQWEASIAIYKYKAEQEMAKAKEEGRPPDVPALMKLEEQIKEAQNKYPVYKQMMTLGQQREAIMGSYKKRITSMGLLDEGFKKDVEKYGEPDAVKIALNPEYRRQLDLEKVRAEARIKADEIRYTEQVKAGLKPESSQTTEQLTARALRGDREAAEILKKMQADKLELARAQGGIKQEQENAGIDIPGIAEAVSNGQDSRVAIKNTRGNNVATKVESAVLKKYPKFDFNMADANYKWKSSQTNMRTINYAQGSMQRVAALYQQVSQLKNTNIPAINKIMREVSVNLGKPEYTNFESNRNAIVQEVNTALSGSATGSDLRVNIELENLKSARSPKQLQGAITNLYEALFARLDVDLSPIYPIEVVRGEKSMAQYKKDLYKKYLNNYSPNHNQQEVPKQTEHDFAITASTYPQEIMDKYKVSTTKANELYKEAKQTWMNRAKELNPSLTLEQIASQWKAKGGR